jgi:hypothetical protein
VIVGVALKLPDGTVQSLPRPHRHNDLIYECKQAGMSRIFVVRGEQGFVDEQGRFLGRREAGVHAVSCGQIERLAWPPELFSEDLW